MKLLTTLRQHQPLGQHTENSDQHSDHDGYDTPRPLHISPYTALEVRLYADTVRRVPVVPRFYCWVTCSGFGGPM